MSYPLSLAGLLHSVRKPQGDYSLLIAHRFSFGFLLPFSNTLLETIFEPLDAILLHFGRYFASILDALGHKNEVQNAFPFTTSQNL